MGRPLKISLARGDLEPHLIRGSFGSPEVFIDITYD